MPDVRLFSRILVLGAVSAVLATLGDRVHTLTGVLYYPHPTAFEEPWWVLPLMAIGGTAMAFGHSRVRRTFGEPADGSTGAAVRSVAWFMAMYVVSGVFHAYSVALTLLFTATFVARVLREPPSRAVWVHGVGTAVLGTTWEAWLSSTRAFVYLQPETLMFGRVPIWLPALYLHAALAARDVERRWPLEEPR